MKQFLRLFILLIGAAGLSSCGASASSFLETDDGMLKAEPSRWIYSLNTSFVKAKDLTVYLYHHDGGLSKLSVEDVSIQIKGEPVEEYYRFEASGTYEIGVNCPKYPKTESTSYAVTVLNAEEEDYYDNSDSGGGIEIIITGP